MKIKQGSTRIVFIFKYFSIKFPQIKLYRLFLYGILSNIQENSFSKTKNNKLCPVLFMFPLGLFIIMKTAQELSEEQYKQLNYKKFIKDKDMIIPVEHKISSFGILDNNIVAIDYGS